MDCFDFLHLRGPALGSGRVPHRLLGRLLNASLYLAGISKECQTDSCCFWLKNKRMLPRVDPRHVQDSSPPVVPRARGDTTAWEHGECQLCDLHSLNWVIFFTYILLLTHRILLIMVWTCIAAPHPLTPPTCVPEHVNWSSRVFFCLAHQRQHSWYSSPAANSGQGLGTMIGTPVFSLFITQILHFAVPITTKSTKVNVTTMYCTLHRLGFHTS